MASDNCVTLVGNITDDPELRFTPSGAAVANFTVAVNRRYKNPDGQWEDKLDGFFRCNCWRDMAENISESLKKGMRVMVVGRLQQRSWEDGEGNKRSVVEIQVDEVGPSLRWASASVQKSDRSGGKSFGSGGGGGNAGGSGGSGGSGGGGSDWGAPSPASVGGPPPIEEGGF
ncbi:MAG: single-strand DNA-binding protein [Actinomycetota bacterium]|nr:single-strand DNA-binding protein [Actinomycetota bacterium]